MTGPRSGLFCPQVRGFRRSAAFACIREDSWCPWRDLAGGAGHVDVFQFFVRVSLEFADFDVEQHLEPVAVAHLEWPPLVILERREEDTLDDVNGFETVAHASLHGGVAFDP